MTAFRALRGGRARRERPAADEVVRATERDVIGSLLLDPSRILAIAEIVSDRDFSDPRLGLLLQRMTEVSRDGRPATLPVLADELDQRDELERIGGKVALCELADDAVSSAWVVEHARLVRRLSLERQVVLLHERCAAGSREAGNLDELVRLEEEIESLDAPPAGAVERIGFSGAALRSLADRPEPPSPLPGFLDNCPSLHVLVGRPKTGKTTLGLHLAQSWARGVAPWTGAPVLPGSRALVLSAEQPLRRVVATLRRLADWHTEDQRDGWEDRLVIVARDRALSREAAALLKLDPPGLALLRRVLQSAADAGDPFGFVLLDSLSRLKPSEAEENDADAMSAFLGPLAALATDLGAYVQLIHHAGHADRANPVTAPRGSTSIAAVAQAVWKLEPVEGRPWERAVTASGNAIENSTLTLEVAPKCEPGKVLYFRPADPFAQYDIDALIPAGSALSLNRIAQKLTGDDGKVASGAAQRRARDLVAHWVRLGLVSQEPLHGKGAVLVRRGL